MALVGDPELLFLDEPTTGFDPSARRQAWDVIGGLRDLGKTVFLTTHYMDEAQRARRPGRDHRRRSDRRQRDARGPGGDREARAEISFDSRQASPPRTCRDGYAPQPSTPRRSR